jgi:hypothetical protein
MPGRLRSSFRSGNLAEDFGLLLLKGIAAVAEVSRTEDVGLDAVASLLRKDGDGNCYAEDSFVVQLKTDSTASIEYRDHALKWLLGQTLPMFIGLVSLKDCRISLFPTINVNAAAFSLHAERLVIHFSRSDMPPFIRGTTSAHWGGENVWLGEPLLTWALADLRDPTWDSAYRILKPFLPLARTALDVLSIGQSLVLKYSTNDVNSICTAPAAAKGSKGGLILIRDRIASTCNAIMLNSSDLDCGNGTSILKALVQLAEALRKEGVDIDPPNLFSAFLSMAEKRIKKTVNLPDINTSEE